MVSLVASVSIMRSHGADGQHLQFPALSPLISTAGTNRTILDEDMRRYFEQGGHKRAGTLRHITAQGNQKIKACLSQSSCLRRRNTAV